MCIICALAWIQEWNYFFTIQIIMLLLIFVLVKKHVNFFYIELPEPYSVITISSNVEEPIPFGSEVTLTCEGAPETGDVFYSWSRDNIDWEVNTSSVTFKVGVYFTKTFNAYCNVYRTNEKVAVGMRTFTVEGDL